MYYVKQSLHADEMCTLMASAPCDRNLWGNRPFILDLFNNANNNSFEMFWIVLKQKSNVISNTFGSWMQIILKLFNISTIFFQATSITTV